MSVLTAKERLAASRAELMLALLPRRRGKLAAPALAVPAPLSAHADKAVAEVPADDEYASEDQSNGPWAMTKRSVAAWWEFHPARTAAALAQPVVEDYAQRRPLKLVGMAAGVGALLVVTRPWRLLSVSGLAVAALKSSQFSNLALTLMATRNRNRTTTKDHE